MFVVTVLFRQHPEHAVAFLDAVTENARRSLEDEPGCHRFDIAVGEDGPETVFLYELYSDRAAFDAHMKTAHFTAFDTMVAPWVASKEARFYTLAS